LEKHHTFLLTSDKRNLSEYNPINYWEKRLIRIYQCCYHQAEAFSLISEEFRIAFLIAADKLPVSKLTKGCYNEDTFMRILWRDER